MEKRMAAIQSAIQGGKPPGIYRLLDDMDIDDLAAICAEADAQVFYLDGSDIANKAQFLKEIALALNFPDYFGGNWDAFADCLTELDSDDMDRYVLLYTQPENFATGAPADWAIALELLQAAIAYWQTEDMPLYVFCQTHSDQLAHLPVL